jgi:uncharacterized membrane protein YhaH (DUF805 family)
VSVRQFFQINRANSSPTGHAAPHANPAHPTHLTFELEPALKPILISLFCARGRLSRRAWARRLAGRALACALLGTLAATAWGDAAAAIFSALFLWAAGAASVRRLHDAGFSGRQLLWVMLPVLGPLWLLVALLRRGADGPNRFDSRFDARPAPRGDYLQVNIAG